MLIGLGFTTEIRCLVGMHPLLCLRDIVFLIENPHEVYLEAIYVGVYRATIQGLQKFKDIANLDVDEVPCEVECKGTKLILWRSLQRGI